MKDKREERNKGQVEKKGAVLMRKYPYYFPKPLEGRVSKTDEKINSNHGAEEARGGVKPFGHHHLRTKNLEGHMPFRLRKLSSCTGEV